MSKPGERVRISIGSDHAGYELKQHLIGFLEGNGHEVRDHGTDSDESVDYPPFCAAVARAAVTMARVPGWADPGRTAPTRAGYPVACPRNLKP